MELAIPVTQSEGLRGLESDAAWAVACEYLILNVGDLLKPGTPRLSAGTRWVMPIILSNAFDGELGEVGEISVDAITGNVTFTERDRAEVETRAAQLASASPL